MQVGVFMQVMDDDARAVSAVTGLKLQMAGDIEVYGQAAEKNCLTGGNGWEDVSPETVL